MKIINQDTRQGTVKLIVETADDLWYLYTIIDEQDLVSGSSEYKYKIGDGAEGKAKVVKKRVYLTIAVEKADFADGSLRLNGKVVEGPEEVPRGSYHSLDAAEGAELVIKKERWLDYQQEKLAEASQNSKLKTLLVLFDREEALFALLRPNGYDKLLELKGHVPKKGFDQGKLHSFYAEIAKHLADFAQRHTIEYAIAACPAFWKEYLEKELSPELKKKVIFATVSSVDETAITELLRRPELQQALQKERSLRELQLVDEILAALAKDKLVYGERDVGEAVGSGNVSSVFVSERSMMKAKLDGKFAELEKILLTANDTGAKVHLLSTQDAMTKVDGFGGIVAVKRW